MFRIQIPSQASPSNCDFCDISGVARLREDEQIPIDLFIRYGQWFEEQRVPDVESAQVLQLNQGDGRFYLKFDSGEELEHASMVVIASGLAQASPRCRRQVSGRRARRAVADSSTFT